MRFNIKFYWDEDKWEYVLIGEAVHNDTPYTTNGILLGSDREEAIQKCFKSLKSGVLVNAMEIKLKELSRS